MRTGGVLGTIGICLAAALPAASAGAQAGTDIWVAGFSESGSRITVGRPRNVTDRPGYDNQPAFTAAGDAILYTSIREDAQADIWQAWLSGGAPERITSTAESEYSPTPMPDRRHFSVIRVERDSTQRLWKFPLDGGDPPSLVLRALRPVGYHVWVGDHTIGAFVLGSPNALVLVDARTERADTLARDIGRALVRVPGRDAFTFQQLGGDTTWVSEVDVRTQGVRRVAPLPPRAEYHLWTPAGQLVTAAGTRLLLWVDGRWDVLADFAELGVRGISRLALSPRGDRIAFVAEERPAP
jgi:hypothetical protein